jgi:RHH-type rel operon transcriptional repressor/antitoxin RelB
MSPADIWERSEKLRRSAENKLRVVAVRIDPVIEQRLRVLAEATGRKQSFFQQQMIEGGIEAIEEGWLPPDSLAKVRSGALPDLLNAPARPRICSTTARPIRRRSSRGRAFSERFSKIAFVFN